MARLRSGWQSFLVVSTLAAVVACWAPRRHAAYPSFGNIDRKDTRLDKIVPKDAHMEKLADGFDWSEGPVWIKDGGYLLFSDMPRNEVHEMEGRRHESHACS